jgi:hypothetical protein
VIARQHHHAVEARARAASGTGRGALPSGATTSAKALRAAVEPQLAAVGRVEVHHDRLGPLHATEVHVDAHVAHGHAPIERASAGVVCVACHSK